MSDLSNHYFEYFINSLATEGTCFVMQDRPGDAGGGGCGRDLETRDGYFTSLNELLDVFWCNGFGIWIFICEIFFVSKKDDWRDQGSASTRLGGGEGERGEVRMRDTEREDC